jgi:MFS transporter, Spinster family, sphingosine-1-phosphate transporter
MNRRSYAWVVVGLLWMVALLNYLDRQVIFSVFPPIQKELSLTNTQLGLLSSAFLWVYAFLSPLGGFLADRLGRRRVILGSLVIWSLVTWATAHARSFNELLAMRALMGISEAFYLPAALAMVADYHGQKTRSLATGLHQSGLYCGIILGGVGGGWFGEQYGWRFAFTVLGIAGVIYGALVAILLKDAPRDSTAVQTTDRQSSFLPSIREIWRSAGFSAFLGSAGLAAMAYWMVYTWMPTFLYERFGLSLAGAGFAATFYIQMGSFGGILLGGAVADRWSPTNPSARLLTMAAGLLAAGPSLFLVGWTGSNAFVISGLVVFGLGRGCNDSNVMPAMCQIVPSNLRATAFGLYNFTACLVGGGMAVFAGALKDTVGLGRALQLSAVMITLSGLILLRIGAGTPEVQHVHVAAGE